ncbi:MAG: type II toxin-antitoxin system Phd/YefM family antitoxin [bacterium]|nr:type II toxin-antitoxin system Phd/YefM family antitoxin [bacterium]
MSKPSKRTPAEPQIPAAEFKAKCLSLMEDVATHHRSFTVTKRGKPVARLVPIEEEPVAFVGSLRDLVVRADALTEPLGEVWNAEPDRA